MCWLIVYVLVKCVCLGQVYMCWGSVYVECVFDCGEYMWSMYVIVECICGVCMLSMYVLVKCVLVECVCGVSICW